MDPLGGGRARPGRGRSAEQLVRSSPMVSSSPAFVVAACSLVSKCRRPCGCIRRGQVTSARSAACGRAAPVRACRRSSAGGTRSGSEPGAFPSRLRSRSRHKGGGGTRRASLSRPDSRGPSVGRGARRWRPAWRRSAPRRSVALPDRSWPAGVLELCRMRRDRVRGRSDRPCRASETSLRVIGLWPRR